jgi:signal transduction histidine kinase
MTDGAMAVLVPAAFHFTPAMVWSIIAWDLWHYRFTRRPASHFFRIAPVVASCMALHFVLHLVISLTPTQLEGRLPSLHSAIEVVIGFLVVASVATFRHMVPVLPVRERPPSRKWLVTHYGIAVAVSLTGLATTVHLSPRGTGAGMIGGMYMTVVGGWSLYEMWRLAKAGEWTPGGLEVRRFDFAIAIAAILSGGVMMILMVLAGWTHADPLHNLPGLFFHTAFGLLFALPFALRMLGRMFGVSLLTVTTISIAAMIYFGAPALAANVTSPELRRLVHIVTVLSLALLLSGDWWLEAIFHRKVALLSRFTGFLSPFTEMVDRIVFRPVPRAELQHILSTLSPQEGIEKCCRRAVEAVVKIMQLRGAAMILFSASEPVTHGSVAVEPLRLAWSAAPPETLPSRAFAGAELRELAQPLKEALIDASVVGVIPVSSPRRRWGHLFIWTGFLETATRDDNVETLQAFADQLALVLDGAELLGRVVGVERSLAHAEKLAAIGELAARVAHEIRNPVTAARSLAQQLVRETDVAFHDEHAMILTELERVERQVAALLRFARREEFQFEPVDLGALVRATAEQFRARLESAGVDLRVDARDGIVAVADKEKLRQVLVNLIENAIDAMATTTRPRQLALRLATDNGSACLAVADNGSGAASEDLPHLFEPFFSRKGHGTGLGLAIAKRTIDAHGGRIVAEGQPGAGMTFSIDLPLAKTGTG